MASVERPSKGEHTARYHNVTQLRLGYKESYKWVSKYREDALRELQVTPDVDLYASALHFTEGLYCSLKDSCFRYAQGMGGTIWANPPLLTPLYISAKGGA